MGPSVRIERRLAWPDTDAAGVWHHSTLWRWVEEAEAELHRRLGIVDRTFGHTPRRHLEAEFLLPLRFDDAVDVELEVTSLGRSSVTYTATVRHDGAIAARATMTSVLVLDGVATPWPEWAAPLRPAGRDG
jgi:YbgC/YbaW family acyl-CoA thioester hydrolase